MALREAIAARRSVRGFLPTTVPAETLRGIAVGAARPRPAVICSPDTSTW